METTPQANDETRILVLFYVDRYKFLINVILGMNDKHMWDIQFQCMIKEAPTTSY